MVVHGSRLAFDGQMHEMFVGYVDMGKAEKWPRNVAHWFYWVFDGEEVAEDGQGRKKMAGKVVHGS